MRPLRPREYILCGTFSLLPVLLWGASRIHKDGTYFIIQMFANDVVRRSSEAIEGHTGNARYYIDQILSNDHGLVLLVTVLIISGIIQWLRFDVSKINHIFSSDQLIVLFSILIPLAVFTIAKSKLSWYIFCIYPSIILLTAISFHYLLKHNPFDFKVGALIIAFSVLFLCSWKNTKQIARSPSYSTNAIQNLLSSKQDYARANFYIEKTDGSDWSQAILLEAEWLSNCTPTYGGANAFIQDNNSYLIIPETKIDNFIEYPIIQKSSGYILLYNHSIKK